MDLDILKQQYPRAFYFRITEEVDRFENYEEWVEEFDKLQGVMGKALCEEKSDRTLKSIRYYNRFSREHPDDLVLLHFNGNARDPLYRRDDFFAGHWLYTNGATVVSDVPDDFYGVHDVEVSDTSKFTLWTGRYFDRGEDLGMCVLDEDGKPDWSRAEQVQLLDIDHEAGTLKIRRGCHGTLPIGFQGGKAYIAAHVIEGPWNGKHNNLMWFYNFSTHCPRDENGKNCADVLAEQIAWIFSEEGPLRDYSGIEFDVLFSSLYNHPYYYLQKIGPGTDRLPDCNADGVGDMGIFDGVDTHGVGQIEFCKKLRELMGDDRLILADAGWWHGQRSFGILNGIESEGMEVDEDGHAQWGHMLNTHLYWNYQSREPNLNYYMLARRQSHMTDGTWRIGMAAAQLAGSANAVTTRPSAPAGERPNDWDEITNAGQGPGWLGAPKGDLVRMGLDEEDILGGIDEDFLERIAMENGEVEIADGCIRLEGDESKRRFFMNVQDVEFEGRDLIVTLHATGEKMAGYPEEGKRLVWLTHMQGGEPISDAGAWGTHQRRHSYFLDDDYVTVFYYPDMPEEGAVDLKFEFEGSEPVSIDELRIIPAVDACYREFENGVVLVNPGKQPYTFNLAELFPGRQFRRIAGRPDQCPETNTGEPVGDTVELPVHDALFLVAD